MASLLAKVEKFPPFLCRILARKNRGRAGLSHLELSKLSGLSKSKVAELSFKTTWAGIPVDIVDRFSTACGVNHLQTKLQVDFLVRRQLGNYILRAPHSRKVMYRKLFSLLSRWSTTPKSNGLSTG